MPNDEKKVVASLVSGQTEWKKSGCWRFSPPPSSLLFSAISFNYLRPPFRNFSPSPPSWGRKGDLYIWQAGFEKGKRRGGGSPNTKMYRNVCAERNSPLFRLPPFSAMLRECVQLSVKIRSTKKGGKRAFLPYTLFFPNLHSFFRPSFSRVHKKSTLLSLLLPSPISQLLFLTRPGRRRRRGGGGEKKEEVAVSDLCFPTTIRLLSGNFVHFPPWFSPLPLRRRRRLYAE